MSAAGDAILAELRIVAHERWLRAAEPGLAKAVGELKRYQQQRFRRSYADLLADQRYTAAADFFLDELYGPHDFTSRDDQFARMVPALVRLFPAELVQTVTALAALHALSEQLDSAMARHLLSTRTLDASEYLRAWQATGRASDRERQVDMLLEIGHELDLYTQRPLVRQSLRLMRVPARASGLGELQTFLERGFDSFRQMRGAQTFLATLAFRERALMARLFATRAAIPAAADDPLGQLP